YAGDGQSSGCNRHSARLADHDRASHGTWLRDYPSHTRAAGCDSQSTSALALDYQSRRCLRADLNGVLQRRSHNSQCTRSSSPSHHNEKYHSERRAGRLLKQLAEGTSSAKSIAENISWFWTTLIFPAAMFLYGLRKWFRERHA